jgi:hypothetical protein
MSKRAGRLALKKKRMGSGMKSWPDGVWVGLPRSVIQARAGLIPSEETDANPPPDGLTAGELLRWDRGLPVLLKTKLPRHDSIMPVPDA